MPEQNILTNPYFLELKKEFLLKINSSYINKNITIEDNIYYFLEYFENFRENILIFIKNFLGDEEERIQCYNNWISDLLNSTLEFMEVMSKEIINKTDHFIFLELFNKMWQKNSINYQNQKKLINLDEYHEIMSDKIRLLTILKIEQTFKDYVQPISVPDFPKPDGYSTFSELSEQLSKKTKQ
jgi:hypothetical protein